MAGLQEPQSENQLEASTIQNEELHQSAFNLMLDDDAANDDSQAHTPACQTPNSNDGDASMSDGEAEAGPVSSGGLNLTSNKSKKKQVRTSVKNPYHGFVKGAQRGTHKFCT
jgi:hypothetical protein